MPRPCEMALAGGRRDLEVGEWIFGELKQRAEPAFLEALGLRESTYFKKIFFH